jgi:cell wall-associated NlpC family hydrolase
MSIRVNRTATFVSAMTATFMTLASSANADPKKPSPQDPPVFRDMATGANLHSAVNAQVETAQDQVHQNELNRLREAAEKTAAREAKEARVKAETSKASRQDPVRAKQMRQAVAPSGKSVQAVIDWARTKLGLPYVWGGESEAEGGYDCSGLTLAAFEQIGVTLPRVAQDQYYASNMHPSRDQLQPGDLVFYGTSSNLHHVGMYVGDGMMLHAPNPRSVIRIDRMDYMSDYFGATRVA